MRLLYGSSIPIDPEEESILTEWACDADRCRWNLAHSTTRAQLTIERNEPWTSGRLESSSTKPAQD